MNIPFQYGQFAQGENFINRQDEQARLSNNFESGVNTMIISPRRWGKSSLVARTMKALADKKELRIGVVDLFSVRTEQQFLKLFAREAIKATSTKWEEWGDSVRTFIRTAIPKLVFGSQPGAEVELELNWADKKIDPLEIYNLPEIIAQKQNIRVVMCLDEFQNIAHFSDALSVQQQMRSVWQKQQRASYCLFGSKRHFLTDIFTNYSMPFYRFGDLMYLPVIELRHWEKFIPDQFQKFGKHISLELTQKLCEAVKLHPYYIQQLAQKTWIAATEETTRKNLESGIDSLLNDNASAFQRDVESMTSTQLNFLQAFMNGVREFTSQETLRSYELGSQGNIKRIRTALEQKDILDFLHKEPQFVDPLFELWLRRNYFKM